jgi:methylenetetrahydrofolate reductase (NADPH)
VRQLREPAHLTITCSPRHGLDATVAFAEALAGGSHVVVPHLAARRVRSRAHLGEVLSRLAAAGIDEAVVVGGDGDAPEGPYATALELLRAIHDLPNPPSATIAAYPEGHPMVSSEDLSEALQAKQTYAGLMTTQMCFSVDALMNWLRQAREYGIDLPAIIGVPGRVDRQKLLAMSLRIGVGASARLLRKQPRMIAQLFAGAGAPRTSSATRRWPTLSRTSSAPWAFTCSPSTAFRRASQRSATTLPRPAEMTI